jgi:hypothetical protein
LSLTKLILCFQTGRTSSDVTGNEPPFNCKPDDSDSDDTRDRREMAALLFRRPFTKELSKFNRKRKSMASIPYRPYNSLTPKEADHTYMKDEKTPFAVDALRRIEPANGCDYSFSLKADREGVLDLYDVNSEY